MVVFYLYEIAQGNITNINQVPRLWRNEVKKRLPDYGFGADEDGNIYVLD